MSFAELDTHQLNRAWGGMAKPPGPPELPKQEKETKPPKQERENLQLAFYPTDHYNMARDGARHAGFGSSADATFAAATHNVDYNNFGEPHAHANSAVGESLQHAIDSNTALAGEHGRSVHHAITEYAMHPTDQNASAIVDSVGVANHQLEDAYAHRGMSFAQHHALDASGHSPDANPITRAEATDMTGRLMAEVASEMRQDGIDPGSFQPPAVHNFVLPTPSQIGPMLDYKFHSPAWDGVDTRWDPSVNQQMYDAFVSGLHRR
jgi:hypothetical protein